MNSPYNEYCLVCENEFDAKIQGIYRYGFFFCCRNCFNDWYLENIAEIYLTD